jgi:DNA-directed RNA polymerase specialized sigma24 family protein
MLYRHYYGVIAAFGGTSKFSTWLCGIANNKAADWGRARRRGIPVAEIDDEALTTADPSADFVARMEDAESEAAFRQCADTPRDELTLVFREEYE